MIREAIIAYFRGLDSRRSPAAGVLELARLGCVVQSSRDPEGGIVSWEPGVMRLCSREDVQVLRAYYWSSQARTRWETRVLMLGDRPWLDAHGQPRTEPVQVARESTDAEAADELGITPRMARRMRARAEGLVADALQLMQRDHEAKCE